MFGGKQSAKDAVSGEVSQLVTSAGVDENSTSCFGHFGKRRGLGTRHPLQIPLYIFNGHPVGGSIPPWLNKGPLATVGQRCNLDP